jgi:parvulin-like peptidyl-prolyl isomerase
MNKTKWHRQPVLHFLVLGVLLFALYTFFRGRTSEPENRIEVSAAEIVRLRDLWTRQWKRPPTEKELRGLVEDFIRQEILYREALAMGLDQNDTVIRRRLAQKVEFLSNDLAAWATPTEDEIQQYFQGNAERYSEPARVSLSHVYFSQDRRGAAAEADASELLGKLRSDSIPPEKLQALGDPFMLQSDYPSRSRREIRDLFGTAFAESVFELEPGPWQGPVESSYGLHLVRVHRRTESRLPELAEVRDRVQTDLLDQRRRDLNKAFYESLRQRYEVIVDDTALAPEEQPSGADAAQR